MSNPMSFDPSSLWSWIPIAAGLPLYYAGGLRFRRWAVKDRPGIPRYSMHLETVYLWLIYSGMISMLIVFVKQAMRRLV
ncbi:MAG: hypothetical protein R3F21_01800 [Myxococcota bacterium]